MKLTVCIGSACHIKGSRSVVETFRELIGINNLSDKIELTGTFCMGKCDSGVCVDVDGEFFSVNPKKAKEFFEENIIPKVKSV